jgi:hypothetical protein
MEESSLENVVIGTNCQILPFNVNKTEKSTLK